MPTLAFEYLHGALPPVLLSYAAPFNDPVPATRRPQFRALLRQVRSHGNRSAVLVAAPNALGVDGQAVAAAVRAVEAAGGALLVADQTATTVAAHLRDPRLLALLEEALEPAMTLHVGPASDLPEAWQWHRPTLLAARNRTTGEIYLRLSVPANPPLADVAHEVMHIIMAREGYPVLSGEPDAVGLTNAILDLEVDRRVAAAGIDPYAMLDEHLLARAGKTVRDLSPSEVCSEVIMRSAYPTAHPEVRERYLTSLARWHPGPAAVAATVLAAAGPDGAALRSAGGTREVLQVVADQLLAEGLGEYHVMLDPVLSRLGPRGASGDPCNAGAVEAPEVPA